MSKKVIISDQYVQLMEDETYSHEQTCHITFRTESRGLQPSAEQTHTQLHGWPNTCCKSAGIFQPRAKETYTYTNPLQQTTCSNACAAADTCEDKPSVHSFFNSSTIQAQYVPRPVIPKPVTIDDHIQLVNYIRRSGKSNVLGHKYQLIFIITLN